LFPDGSLTSSAEPEQAVADHPTAPVRYMEYGDYRDAIRTSSNVDEVPATTGC
jgi:hypothetical protein